VTVDSVIERADQSARAVATAASVTIRPVETMAEFAAVADLCAHVWGSGPEGPPLRRELLRALAHAGNYVAAAFGNGDLVGACVGFFGPPGAKTLHSHIAAVSRLWRGHDVGFALKLHQRAWALHAGVDDVTWTFDPLVRRNAYFNVAKLAAQPEAYVPDFYGVMDDELNRGAATDRLLVRWQLRSQRVIQACEGRHSIPPESSARRARGDARALLSIGPSGGPMYAADRQVHAQPLSRRISQLLLSSVVPTTSCPGEEDAEGTESDACALDAVIAIPLDIESMREAAPALAEAWRSALRRALGDLMTLGGTVQGFDATTGSYLCRIERQMLVR
jgi:predicted GNAT superfamily acetyltransferase